MYPARYGGWVLAAALLLSFALSPGGPAGADDAPVPLLQKDRPVDWWFAFKFNTKSFRHCGGSGEERVCPFGGTVQPYAAKRLDYAQQFVYASSAAPALQKGSGCAGETPADPIGATFAQVYGGSFNYLIWNDQFYGDPRLACANSKGNCDPPWGHSKGLLAWNDAGEGLVLQVSTPSWPAAGSKDHPRTDGNTLGCVTDDNVFVSQHFFSLRLTKDDLLLVLKALANASVATNPADPQISRNGGPAEVQALVAALGSVSQSVEPTKDRLSSGVVLLSKPSRLHVPPWQMVSALLGGVPLRVASWWNASKIYTTTASARITCWAPSLGRPGRVEIATTGQWEGTEFGLTGGMKPDGNHAKVGVSIGGGRAYAIFGDMNQEGAIAGNCTAAQDRRGGLFFVVDNEALAGGVGSLLDGETAPTRAPRR